MLSRHKLHALIVLALFIQALIPHGFMPNLNADNAFELSICRSSDITNEAQDTGDNEQNHGHQKCPYAPVSSDNTVSNNGKLPLPSISRDAHRIYALHNAKATYSAKSWQSQAPPASL